MSEAMNEALNEELLLNISPFVRRARIMQTVELSGKWTDYDHCVTGIIAGEADFIVQDSKFHLVKGDVIIIPPLCNHTIVSTTETPLLQYILHFDFYYRKSRASFPETMSFEEFQRHHTLPKEENVMNNIPLVVHLNRQELLEFQTGFLHLLNEYKDKSQHYRLSMKALCINLLVVCLRNQNKTYLSVNTNTSKAHINVQRAIEFINRNYDNPLLDNDTVAAAIGISSKYLSQIFHAESGISVHKYLTQVRIEAAQKLAVLGTMNVTEIAYAVGYPSIHTFSKIFKKTTGVTPSEFLQANLKRAEDIYIKNDAMNRPKKKISGPHLSGADTL